MVCCGFQSKGDPDCFILLALQRPKENVFVPISVWCIISGLQLSNSPLQRDCVGDPKSAPTWAGAVWSPRDSSGCTSQPKHPSTTRGLENHDVSEDSEEHQALLQNCVSPVFHIYWLKEESLVRTWPPSKPGSSIATVGWLVRVLIFPSTGSALTGAPPKEAHFSCAKTLRALHQQWLCVCRSDLPLLPYPGTCFLSPDRAESKAPCARLQYLQDRDAASYPLPWAGSVTWLSHFGWSSLSQVEVLV